MNEQIRFQLSCSGTANILRELGAPLASSLEADPAICLHDGDRPFPIAVLQEEPVADVTAVAAAIGVLVFVGSWTAAKLLDELYLRVVRPKVVALFQSTGASSLPNRPGKKWLFQLGVWYEEEQVMLLLVIAGDSLKDVLRHEHLIPTLHSSAVDWVIRNGVSSPVHLYIAESGTANLEPLGFNTLQEATRHLEQLWPVIITTDGSSPIGQSGTS